MKNFYKIVIKPILEGAIRLAVQGIVILLEALVSALFIKPLWNSCITVAISSANVMTYWQMVSFLFTLYCIFLFGGAIANSYTYTEIKRQEKREDEKKRKDAQNFLNWLGNDKY